ncbi:MAG: tripartite tricarboxylate transporter substrate binding protein [Desulfovibrio sp.]|jgi:tripartite-type tricarboxylate transporter receptor subunit TctC|nr:tripartite tricarboxylate transporter substrate binding protein [Desulfovibrio sp.]
MKTRSIFQVIFGMVLYSTIMLYAFSAEAANKPANYPLRPVTVIVPFGAGGGADQMARAFLQQVSKIIKVPVIVVNKPGGNATLGFNDFWIAPADGYTLLQYNDDGVTHFVGGILKENPTKDYIPIAIAMVVYSQIYIRPNDTRFHDWNSFVAYAKANPGKVSLGNIAQRGNLEEIQAVQLEKAAGIKFRQISFDKPSERYSALVGGHVDALLEQPGDVAAYLKSNDMKPIFSFTDGRSTDFMEIPCLTDLDKNMRNVYKVRGFYMNPAMSKDKQEYLLDVFKQAYETPEFQRYISDKYPADKKYRNFDECIDLLNTMIDTYIQMYKVLGYANDK